METNHQPKLKRKLGFWASLGGSVGLVVSGTAMVSVGAVAGQAGSGTWLIALVALIPMLAVACAYGELTSMLPGGGMISDFTMPALGKFWSIQSILYGYILLVACDGGTQQIVGALAFQELTGIPYLPVVIVMMVLVVVVNVFGVEIYGRVEVLLTLAMMIVFFLVSTAGFFGLGESMGVASKAHEITPFAPENGWAAAMMCAGTAVWWYIGFEFVCPMAEENKEPHKNIPKALITGLIIVFLTDVFFAMGSAKYADITALAASSTPQIVGAKAMLGQFGYIVTIFITILAAITSAIAHVSALPRMLYGMAHKDLAPKIFAYVHPRYRTPVAGIIFTLFLISITIVYMYFKGTGAAIIVGLINIACTTWLLSYAIACINVLYYRKKYPDFPRLWKTPKGVLVMAVGLLGIAYCIWTMHYIWLPAGIAILVFALYGVLWLKHKKIPLNEKEPIEGLIENIMNRSEALPIWDEAVTDWMRKHPSV